MKHRPALCRSILFCVLSCAFHLNGFSQNKQAKRNAEIPEGTRTFLDIEYVKDGHPRHRLDLYVPAEASGPRPIILWVHGGGWQGGDKARCPGLFLLKEGFAVASINYRFSQHAIFPAQIHDCKAAIRWLRGHADEYGLNRRFVGAWGSSAGGHLVALLGTTNGEEKLEGNLGYAEQSSNVQAVIDWFGPTDFLTVGPKDTRSNLLGGDAQSHREQAILASPIHYVSKNSVPFLVVHGKEDKTVSFDQSATFAEALQKAGVEATLVAIDGAGHGGPLFSTPPEKERIIAFFKKHLK